MAFNHVAQVRDEVPVRNVLVSTFDKRGLPEFARAIAERCPGARFYSTGGTYVELARALGDGKVVQVSDYTGQPEMSGGLVKTLDWKIYLGLLAEDGDESHRRDIDRTGAAYFDMVIVNLYPFARAVPEAAGKSDAEIARQHIDIGGPCMLRAASKNHLRVAAVSDPDDYGAIAEELSRRAGSLSLATRRRLAAKAFAAQAAYDAAVAAWLSGSDSGAGYTVL